MFFKDCSKIALKLLWNCSKNNRLIRLKSLRLALKIAADVFEYCTGFALELLWSCSGAALKLLGKLSFNSYEELSNSSEKLELL